MDELVGKRLGNYQIDSSLGAGGMAHVYKATDLTLKRTVAIKVISPGLSVDPKYLDRFEREAQSIASLEHPHIVPVYYFGKSRDIFYLAMKFIEGEDLSILINRYAAAGEYLPYTEILRVTESIGSALDYAHNKGVIHRDLKPSNIMIDVDGRPYLTDFGLALNLGQGSIGEVFGTPHYISPEQARNSASAVPQSDLYALGVILFELFTGIVPFDDPSPTAVALQHVMNPPPAPRSFNNDLSSNIDAMILKALAKQPEERYQSGAELTTALREAIQNPGRPTERMEMLAFPPLPAGVQAPPPRRPSMRPLAGEVRASMAIRPSDTRTAQPRSATMSGATKLKTQAAPAPATQRTSNLPVLVLGGVVLVVLVIVLAVALLSANNNTAQIALLGSPTPTEGELPTLFPTTAELVAAPTDKPTTPPPTIADTDTAVVSGFTNVPTATPPNTEIPPTSTEIPPTPLPTTEPPTVTPIPPTETLIPPTSTPEGPTSAPNNWLPVRFIYDANAFYWMNDADRTISSASISFARVGGSEHFEGNRFAYYSMERGRCMQIMFADVAQTGCPEGRRPNAFFTPTRTQDVDFWTGSTGQFEVFWDGTHIATCDIAAGECAAYIPR